MAALMAVFSQLSHISDFLLLVSSLKCVVMIPFFFLLFKCRLRERTESLKLEMGKITGDMKTNYDSLKKDVSRTGDEVTSHAEK